MALSTVLDVYGRKSWIKRAGLIAIPAILSRKKRGAGLSRFWVMGALSLLGFGFRQLARTKGGRAGVSRWKLPQGGAMMSEEFAASAASGR
ncbi:hypothetical protein SAMN05444354_103322 [Stigmatella aurantiaca]|uniref:Uncharacterized protein n=1 Tax=Stigmatella aurantiaca TaxID=41 RepID=A0A1H7LTG3_STIAU|nr:hypothetical protein [Stigmatella aurantiaca]SEL01755.1 hypothetical protein SAMN05444354_103322 [Stigmatella aurantiaca]